MADELAKRLEKTIPPEIMKDDEEGESPEVLAAQQQVQELQGQLQALGEEFNKLNDAKEVDQAKLQLEAQKMQLDAEVKALQAQIDQRKLELEERKIAIEEYKAETERLNNVPMSPEQVAQLAAQLVAETMTTGSQTQEAQPVSPELMQTLAQMQQQMQLLAQPREPVVINLPANKPRKARAVRQPDGSTIMEDMED